MANSIVKLTLESNQYEQGIRQAQKAWKDFTDGIGLSASKFTAVTAAIGAVTGALKVAKDAFFKNEQQLDDWNRMVESSKSVYNGFLNALNTGDISGYLTNINSIVQAARDAYNALDELNTFNAFNQINMQKSRTGLTEAIAGYRMGETSKESVKAAAEAYKNELIQRQEREQETYMQAVRKVAMERGVPWGNLEQALSGDYGTYQKLKETMPSGSRMVSQSMGQWGTTMSYQVPMAVTAEEKMGETLRKLNDTELKSLQALGAQAQRTGNEIAQVDKTIARILNGTRSGGGSVRTGGGGRGGGSVKEPPVPIETLIQSGLNKAVQDFIAYGATMKMPTDSGTVGSDAWSAYSQSMARDFEQPLSPLERLNAELAELRENLEKAPDTATYQLGLQAIADKEKEIKKFKGASDTTEVAKSTANSWQSAAQSIGAVGSALTALEDPGAKIAGIIGQAVAQIALGFAQATAASTGGGVFGWIAAITGGLGTMVSTIAAIHSATGFSEGGVVKGSTFSGDQIPAMLNAGEVVLTRAQAGVIASNLQNAGGLNNLKLQAIVSGTQLRFVLNNESQQRGRGQYVTTNFR